VVVCAAIRHIAKLLFAKACWEQQCWYVGTFVRMCHCQPLACTHVVATRCSRGGRCCLCRRVVVWLCAKAHWETAVLVCRALAGMCHCQPLACTQVAAARCGRGGRCCRIQVCRRVAVCKSKRRHSSAGMRMRQPQVALVRITGLYASGGD
jgi:hypothetical protein